MSGTERGEAAIRARLSALVDEALEQYDAGFAVNVDRSLDALAAALAEHEDCVPKAEFDAVQEEAGTDVLTAWRVRNAALAVAAAFVHPGPDWEDEQARKRLVEEWVGEGHDQVAEENRQRLVAIQRMIAAEAVAAALRTEREALEKALALVCDDAFSDRDGAVEHYLDLARTLARTDTGGQE